MLKRIPNAALMLLHYNPYNTCLRYMYLCGRK